MKSDNHSDGLIPPALLAELAARATAEQRRPGDVLRDAIENYLREWPSAPVSENLAERTPREAAERMPAQRKRHPLPEGMSIRDMQTFGRA